MSDFKKNIQKLDLGDLHAEQVKPTDNKNDVETVLWRCGGCYRCGGCGGCYRCGGCGGCYRCGGCFGCFGCFFCW
ncbi:heterocycloanthracin/sonorensin family bacteriocin [Alicyclobacillus sp. ALC3]|nr:heterocycloanthracin/sonorensin family bacteriocin [Alicyclobacillus sp. ALC3]